MSVSRRRASVPAASAVPHAEGPKREKGAELKLADEWTFWYEDGYTVRSEDYKNKVKTIGNFSTVQGFWRYWNAFNFANFPDSCSLSLFKNGISPMWEDPANQNGGRYIVFSNRRDSINKYFSLILAAIGSQFDHHNDICGITIAAKSQHSATVSLWNRSSVNKKAISDTLNQVAELTSTLLEKIFYRPHPSNSLCLPGAPVPAARSSSGGIPVGPFYQDPNEPGSPVPQDNDDKSRLNARRSSSSQDHRKTRSLASSSQSRKAHWQVHKKSSSEAIGLGNSSSSSSSSSPGASPVSSPLIRPRLNASVLPPGSSLSSSPSSVVPHVSASSSSSSASSSSSSSSTKQKTIIHSLKKTLKSFSFVQTFVGNDGKASFTDFLFPFAALFFISFMLVVSSMSIPQ